MSTFSRQFLRKWAILMEILGFGIGVAMTLRNAVDGSSMNYGINPYSIDELAVSEVKMLEYLIQHADDQQLSINSELRQTIDT